jgi:hypothetical protein
MVVSALLLYVNSTTILLKYSIHIVYILCGVVNGYVLSIIQSSLLLWSFEHSVSVTPCACLDALMASCCTACIGESKFMRCKYEGIAYLDLCQAALTWRKKKAETCMSTDCTITLLHFGVVEHSAKLSMGVFPYGRLSTLVPLHSAHVWMR